MGSNLPSPVGPPRATLLHALDRLEAPFGPLTRAPFYRTPPVSHIPQPAYLNTVALGRTELPPERVLALCKELEREAGRDLSPDAPRNGPRPLDVDVLWLGDTRRDDPALILPHPRLTERWFVLAPLADVAPDTLVPGTDRTVARWLAELPGADGGERVD